MIDRIFRINNRILNILTILSILRIIMRQLIHPYTDLTGGEWLRGAGQFNDFLDLPPETWAALGARSGRVKRRRDGGGTDGAGA